VFPASAHLLTYSQNRINVLISKNTMEYIDLVCPMQFSNYHIALS